jgi:hypothetical protein
LVYREAEMTVKVNIIENGEGVEIVATGTVNGREIIQAQEQIYDEKYLANQRFHIIDKSKCTEFDVTVNDIMTISKFDKRASVINPNIIIAIVESEFLRSSLSNLWQAKVNDFIFKTKSFTNRHEAMAWINDNKKS